MPTKERSPVWFINNIVLPKFKDLAKAKQFAIKTTNSAVLDINSKKKKPSTSPPTSLSASPSQRDNNCNSCLQIFDTKSRPSICNACERYFHKTKCLREHTKTCRQQSQHNSSTNTARPAVMTSLPSTLADTLSSTTTSTSMGIPSSSNGTLVTLPPTLPPISSGPLLPQPERLTGLQTLVSFVPHTQRNDEPPPVSTSVSPPQPPSTPPAHPSQTRGNKKKQKLPPITNEQARINFL